MRTLNRFLVRHREWYYRMKPCSPEHKKCLYLPVLLSVQEFSDALHTQTLTFHLYCLPLSVSFTLPCCQLFWLFEPFTPWTSRPPPPHVKKHSPFPSLILPRLRNPSSGLFSPFTPGEFSGTLFLIQFRIARFGRLYLPWHLLEHHDSTCFWFSAGLVSCFSLLELLLFSSWIWLVVARAECFFVSSCSPCCAAFVLFLLIGDNIKFRLVLEGVRAP